MVQPPSLSGFRTTDHCAARTGSVDLPLQQNTFETEPFRSPQGSFPDVEILASHSLPQTWNALPCSSEGTQSQLDESSISNAYSKGLLNDLTHALGSSGVDLSQATISVQFDIKKGTSSGATSTSFGIKIAMVSTLKHDNLVELCGYCVEGNTRVLAYEFATMGSLHDILHGRKGVQGAQPGPVLDWMQRVRIGVDAAKGLDYLHDYLHEKVQPSIIHRDIRSSNVLLFEDLRAKIADFNLSNQAPDMAARLSVWMDQSDYCVCVAYITTLP